MRKLFTSVISRDVISVRSGCVLTPSTEEETTSPQDAVRCLQSWAGDWPRLPAHLYDGLQLLDLGLQHLILPLQLQNLLLLGPILDVIF